MLLPVLIVIKQHSLISPETKVCLLGSPWVSLINRPLFQVILRVTQGYWKRNHSIYHNTSYLTLNIIVTLKCELEVTPRSMKMIPFESMCTVSYSLQLWPYLWPFRRYSASNNGLTLKSGFGVVRGHWKWHHLIDRTRVPISVPW